MNHNMSILNLLLQHGVYIDAIATELGQLHFLIPDFRLPSLRPLITNVDH